MRCTAIAAAWLALLLAPAANAASASAGAGEAFPYPGTYANAHCRIEFAQDGRFEMRGMDCSYPWSDAGGSITTSASGSARVREGHLLLMGMDFLVIQCSNGPRFLPPDEQRDFALAMHSRDAHDLRWRTGFAATADRDRIDFECDLGPMPSGLLRIAQAPPIQATIRSVVDSKCDRYDDEVDCEATVVVDRGEAHGLVAGMNLYFPTCTGDGHALSIRSVGPDTATVELGWRPASAAHASRYVGTPLVTRMPGCVPAERARREQQARDRYELEQLQHEPAEESA